MRPTYLHEAALAQSGNYYSCLLENINDDALDLDVADVSDSSACGEGVLISSNPISNPIGSHGNGFHDSHRGDGFHDDGFPQTD